MVLLKLLIDSCYINTRDEAGRVKSEQAFWHQLSLGQDAWSKGGWAVRTREGGQAGGYVWPAG